MKKSLIFVAILLCFIIAGCVKADSLDPDDPVTLTMWHVYGEQADSPMNRLAEDFNRTLGRKKGIVLDITEISNSSDIGQLLLDAQEGKPGSSEMPDIFFCHTSNATELGTEKLIDWQELFTEEELDNFVPAFVAEGMAEGSLAVLPVSKSTFLLFINEAEFQRFSSDTGVNYENLATWDGFFKAAEEYHNWSGGKAFCAFDYILRCVELNEKTEKTDFLTEDGWYDFADKSLKDSWMQFAEAMVQGHIRISDFYSNTQVMTGEVAAGMGSSAAILYYNDTVTYADASSEPLSLKILPMPQRTEGKQRAVQAGVGMCAYKTTKQEEEAVSVFAHWLTESHRNMAFAVETGYMPVTKEAFESLGDYNFKDSSQEKLYEALKKTVKNCQLLADTNHAGYYGKVYRLYESLRQLQDKFPSRIAMGESPQELAEETWSLFKSVK